MTTRGCWCAPQARQDERVARGLRPTPIKVTVTGHGAAGRMRELLRLRRHREAGLLRERVGGARPGDRFGPVATVVDGGQPVDMHRLSEDLYARGVQRLMVEGGGMVHTQFLTADLADELHLVVAPFFVGDSRARGSSATAGFRGIRTGGRRSRRCARSVTSCCFGTRSRRGSG